MNRFISILAAACAVALMISAPTYAAGYDPNDVGSLGNPNSFQRVITITPETKWVNVDDREIVKFVDAKTGQSFVYSFYTGRTAQVDFSKIAPPGMQFGSQVKAFISELPPPDRDR